MSYDPSIATEEFVDWFVKHEEPTIDEFIDEFTPGSPRHPHATATGTPARPADYSRHAVLDLFAGSGVGVAIKQLGAKEYGVEIMPEAVATREANGMETIYNDVWEIEKAAGYAFDTLWASPPCQTFSMAGRGEGRKALDNVLATLEAGAWKSMPELRRWATELGDERIGLVLTPLAYIYRYGPRYVAFEQVPPVLPVWEAMADEMRKMGYSVWTGYLHSEQYGVPQTRKRAYLIANRDPDWVASPPPVTHSKYYSRTPEKLDPGVRPWVSMAEALGWGATERVGFPRLADDKGASTSGGGTDPAALGGSGARKFVYEQRDGGGVDKQALRSNYGTGGDPANRGRRMIGEPAATVTSKVDRNKWEAA